MNWEIGLIFIGIFGCVLLVWYLYRRSQNETSEDEVEPIENTDDGYEDLLLTGLMLEEIYDDDLTEPQGIIKKWQRVPKSDSIFAKASVVLT